MKTILWFSNHVFTDVPDKATGTWLSAMGQAIERSGEFNLINITQSKVTSITRADCGSIVQWLVPYVRILKNGLPAISIVSEIVKIVERASPDLVHVWGTENYWGLLTSRKHVSIPALLDMQGIKYVIAPQIMAGLTFTETLKCIGVKEFLRPSGSLFALQQEFLNARKFERETIRGHQFIAVQSEWIRVHVDSISPEARLFPTRMMLRNEFIEAKPWNLQKARPNVIFTCSGLVPYKGLHVLLRAISCLKATLPHIQLNIAAGQMQQGIRRSGYARWLLRQVKKLGITKNVSFIGSLDAQGILEQFYKASVVVIPSFIESYSLAMAESLVVGVPTVASYAGAMPELARDSESALFFPSGDDMMCAYQIRRILESHSLAENLSANARRIGLTRHKPDDVLQRQLEIYKQVMNHGQP